MLPKLSQDTVVRLLTIIITPIATGVTAWGAKQGLNLPSAAFVPVGALAGASVLGLGFHWLQKQPAILKGEQDLEDLAKKVATYVNADPALSSSLGALVDKLEANKQEIIGALDKHAPASVQDIIQGLLNQSGASATPTSVAAPPVVPAA